MNPTLWSTAVEDQRWGEVWDSIWESLHLYPRLGTIAQIRRGIDFPRPLQPNDSPGTPPALQDRTPTAQASGLEPYILPPTMRLTRSSEAPHPPADRWPWNTPKVILQAYPLHRGAWPIAAVPDHDGLAISSHFMGLWPNSDIPMNVIAALLNSPVANAFVRFRHHPIDPRRYVRLSDVKHLPIPSLSRTHIAAVDSLVEAYVTTPHREETQRGQILWTIDAEIMRAFDLPPSIEWALLTFFTDSPRPGYPAFTGYYPPGLAIALPLHQIVDGGLERADLRKTLERIVIVEDPDAAAWFTALESTMDHRRCAARLDLPDGRGDAWRG